MTRHEHTEIVVIDGQPRDIDRDIAPLVRALNDAGIATVASCSGHGHRPGSIALADGRELIVVATFDELTMCDAVPWECFVSTAAEVLKRDWRADAVTGGAR